MSKLLNSTTRDTITMEGEAGVAVEYFFASDASAIIEHTNRVIFLEVLYCTVLHCTVLYNCTVLYCTVLYCHLSRGRRRGRREERFPLHPPGER